MKDLQKKLNIQPSLMSPWFAVVIVSLLNAMLITSYIVLANIGHVRMDMSVLYLLLTFSAIGVAGAFLYSLFRVKWIRKEDIVRQRLLCVIDAIPDPSAVRDLKGRYVMWNHAAEAYHGIKADHVLGNTPFDLFPKEVARAVLELDAQCSMSQETIVKKLELPPLYGMARRVVIIRVAPVRSTSDPTDHTVRGIVAILHDVTNIEKEAAELRQSTAQLKLALDTSGFGSWVWDLVSNAPTYSAQYQALLHYQGHNFSQDYVFFDRLHPSDLAVVKQQVKRSIQENKPFDQVYRLRCFDEQYRYFRTSGQPMMDDKGQRQFAGLLCPMDRNAG